MLLFVFGFVGGAVVINSAILVSLSVLLLVHFSISTGVPALTQNLPRILRYYTVSLRRPCLVDISQNDFSFMGLLCNHFLLQIETMENGLKLGFLVFCVGILT